MSSGVPQPGHERWLAVFDNVEDPGGLGELLPRAAAGHVLVTSREDVGWSTLAECVDSMLSLSPLGIAREYLRLPRRQVRQTAVERQYTRANL